MDGTGRGLGRDKAKFYVALYGKDLTLAGVVCSNVMSLFWEIYWFLVVGNAKLWDTFWLSFAPCWQRSGTLAVLHCGLHGKAPFNPATLGRLALWIAILVLLVLALWSGDTESLHASNWRLNVNIHHRFSLSLFDFHQGVLEDRVNMVALLPLKTPFFCNFRCDTVLNSTKIWWWPSLSGYNEITPTTVSWTLGT